MKLGAILCCIALTLAGIWWLGGWRDALLATLVGVVLVVAHLTYLWPKS